MRRVSARLWILVVLALALPLTALGQRTGGSFGGSSWGSGRSSSSSRSSGGSWGSPSRSSGSSWGSPSRSSGSYGTYGGGSYGGSYGGGTYDRTASGGGSLGGLCCVVMFFVLVILVGMALSKRKGVANITYTPTTPPGGYGMDEQDTFSLGALAIAFDSSVRAQVQGELDRVAQAMQMQNTPDALNTAAAQMAQVLGRFLDAAYMTHHSISEGVPMQTAQQQFQQAVDAERGRYIVETVRADAGGVRKVNAPASKARAEEGGGFVVVTVLVARRGRLTGFQAPTDRNILRADLQVLLAGAGALQAMECVWVPSDPNDVMSSAEMAVKFPTLKPLSPDARVGRRACAYCKSVYAAELGRCPNCGATP